MTEMNKIVTVLLLVVLIVLVGSLVNECFLTHESAEAQNSCIWEQLQFFQKQGFAVIHVGTNQYGGQILGGDNHVNMEDLVTVARSYNITTIFWTNPADGGMGAYPPVFWIIVYGNSVYASC